jgi:hypothetical protein
MKLKVFTDFRILYNMECYFIVGAKMTPLAGEGRQHHRALAWRI